jgi:predicted transposase/invertase (TIGR01784 family)
VREAENGLGELHDRYDAAMRVWVQLVAALPVSAQAGVVAWLDPSLAHLAPSEFSLRPSRLVVPAVEADLVVQVGSDHVIHVEFETNPNRDLIRRMLDYRARLMHEYPGCRVNQYVVVLGRGSVADFDDLERFGFTLDVHVVYLRDKDPTELLTKPLLAPFAVLAGGSRSEREQAFSTALRLLWSGGHPKAVRLMQVLEALAGIWLDRSTVERIEKENDMSIEPLVEFYLETEVGQRMVDVGRQEGLGLGLEQGQEQGRERLLLALLRTRFGDGDEVRTAAKRLAGQDADAAVAAITAAPDLASLLN